VAAAAITVLVVALTGGFGGGGGLPAQARALIEDDYFKPVKASALDNASVNGMVKEINKRYGDRFSEYLNPHQLRLFEHALSGRFSGVGLTVTSAKRGLRVETAIPGAPAERAGIKAGDLITGVDGRSIAGVPEQVAVARIKGPPGTPVTLRVLHGPRGQVRTVHLKRASVELPVATGQIRHAGRMKVAYVRYATFSAGAHGELQSTLERLDRRGARGLVLDLRHNGGGLLNEGVLSASLFLRKGQRVVSTKSRTFGAQDYDAVGGRLEPKPTVVLIDHGTASAAEILASALREHHLATIVGTRSFGKGTFQQDLPLDSGGVLKLTVGEYFTANGTSVLGKGIVPDVVARDDPHTKPDEALRKALAVLREKAAAGAG
jgi:carboxyl-terminal processing protease